MKQSHDHPFIETAIVIVQTEYGILAVSGGEILDHQPYPYSAYRMLLEYQNCYPNIHVSLAVKPVRYDLVLSKIRAHLQNYTIESPPQPLVVKQEESSFIILTPPRRRTNSNVMKNRHEVTERAIANSQSLLTGAIQLTFGTAHFVFQSAADLTCYGEAKLISAVNAHQESVEEIMAARRAKTKAMQNRVLEVPTQIKTKYQESLNAEIFKRKDVKLKTA